MLTVVVSRLKYSNFLVGFCEVRGLVFFGLVSDVVPESKSYVFWAQFLKQLRRVAKTD